MAKYCISCGKQNEDEAIFCTVCGQKFPGQGAPMAPQGSPATQPPPMLFTAEMGTGTHKHMLTDVYLRDAAGKLILVARRQSLLNRNYTLVDKTEKVIGYVEHKTHITNTTLTVQDANHAAQGSVRVGSATMKVGVRPALPNCWIEDPAGGKQGSIVFTDGLLGFSAVKMDGSKIFEASLSGGRGLMQALSALGRKSYALNIIDQKFPLPLILGVIAAVDNISTR